jgi:hypothetical protein
MRVATSADRQPSSWRYLLVHSHSLLLCCILYTAFLKQWLYMATLLRLQEQACEQRT